MAFLSSWGYFLIVREVFNVVSACITKLLLDLNKSLSKDQLDFSIFSCDHKFI